MSTAPVNYETQASSESGPTTATFPVVGIGASAGGLQAFGDFFDALPENPGMAFVLVQHLDPNHKSRLAEFLQKNTAMPVRQVKDGTEVEPNHVYVIPPDTTLTLKNNTLHLSKRAAKRGHQTPIDRFFRSLAEDQGQHAVCIILSGTGSDGTLGLKAVKEREGVTMAQDPDEAEYDGMPRTAVATGLVDLVLPVRELAKKLVAYKNTASQIQLPAEAEALPEEELEALQQIFMQLRSETGHDFSNYKRSTILRRIGRRLQVHQIENLSAYLRYLRNNGSEAEALFKDLLISVTTFFRDPEAFDVLKKKVIPQLFEGKTEKDQIRVWVPGCATGEEAYSIAILLCEYAALHDDPPGFQIFATDIDEDAIAYARNGIYPENIAADVSPERLERFFSKHRDGYRVDKQIREMVLFAAHNLIKDPPFSKLDFLSCRNLLIYFNRDVQVRIFDMFHYALLPERFMMLGSSESLPSGSQLFSLLNKKHRLYQHRRVAPDTVEVPRFPLPRLAPGPGNNSSEKAASAPLQSLDEIHRRLLLEQYAPLSVVVDENYEIVHVSKSGSRYLRFAEGTPTSNLLQVVHPSLRVELRTALFTAFRKNQTILVKRVHFAEQGEQQVVNLVVRPLGLALQDEDYVQVVFEEAAPPERPAGEGLLDEDPDASLVEHLEEELHRTTHRLQSSIEAYETSNEELKASNEELQSMNQELQSTTEQLETGKEELQSMNEELVTVNQELKTKIEELNQSNSDLQNLMAATEIGTLFLDRDLRVKRFTPRLAEVFNILRTDVGRPLAHLTHTLDYPALLADARQVLDDLSILEREVTSEDGHWYMAQLRPYRTIDDRINGVVLTFVDITEQKKAAEKDRFQAYILNHINDGVIAADTEGRVLYANKALGQMVGVDAQSVLGKHFTAFYNVEWLSPEDREQNYKQLEQRGYNKSEIILKTHDGRSIHTEFTVTVMTDENGQKAGRLAAIRDITERRQAEQQQRQAEAQYRFLVENIQEYAILLLDADGRITAANPGSEAVMGYTEEDLMGHPFNIIFTPEDQSAGLPEQELKDATAQGSADNEGWRRCKDGTLFWANGVLTAIQSDNGAPTGFIKVVRDTTERRKAEEALRESEEILRLAVEGAKQGIWTRDLTTGRMTFDQQTRQIFAMEPEMSFEEAMQRVHPEDVERVEQALAAALDPASSGEYKIEHRLLLPDETRWLAVSAQCYFEGTGSQRTPRRLIGVAQDITERKAAEDLLNQRTRQQAVVADLGLFAMGTTDVQELMDRAVQRVADTLDVPYCKVLELQPDRKTLLLRAGVGWQEGLVGRATVGTGKNSQAGYTLRTNEAVIVDNLREESRFNGPALLRKHKVVSGISVVIQSDDHPYGVMGAHTTAHRVFSQQDTYFLQAIANILGDALRRQQAEDALRESKDRFQAVAETVPDLLFTTDADINVEYLNQRWTDFTGLPLDKGLGDAWKDLLHPDDRGRVRIRWQVAQQRTDPFEDRHRLRAADGTYRWILVRAQPIVNPDGQVIRWFGTVTDINDLVKAEQEIHQLNETLEERVQQRTAQVRSLASALTLAEQQERRRIAQILHDDLQQMLYGLDMSIQQLRRNDLSEIQERFVQQSETILDQAIDTTRSLTVELSPPVLRGEGLAEAFEWLAVHMQKVHGLEVTFLPEASVAIPSEDMRVLLFQLVRELLFNVTKHAEVDKACTTMNLKGDNVVITVADEGVGFVPEGEKPAAKPHSSSGFGLFSIHERLDLFGGDLQIDSAPGCGTRITITVPVAATESTPNENPED